MDFTPHTDADIDRMLTHLGLSDPADLFDHLPAGVHPDHPLDLPDPMSEIEVMAHIARLGSHNRTELTTFAGGGIYDHHLPPVVRSLTMRPEFVTSYTPYQSEVAQGVLQLLFEYQSMITAVTDLPVANASLYDGPSSGLEAVNLAVADRDRPCVWVSRGLHPHTRDIIRTFAAARHIDVVEHPLVGGRTAWVADLPQEPAAIILAQPNYLGVFEGYDEVRALADRRGALAVAAVDPMLLGVIRSPGEAGFDIAFAEGQPYGNPMSFGGPVLGVFATTRQLMRRLPGRLVGETIDRDGKIAYTLTLRTREQDIRREKASSNICTNQTLNAIAAAVYLSWLGPAGLVEVGRQAIHKAHHLAARLDAIDGVTLAVDSPFGREFPIITPHDPRTIVAAMADHGFLAGIPLDHDYPELAGGILVAVTERRTRQELDAYADAMAEVVASA